MRVRSLDPDTLTCPKCRVAWCVDDLVDAVGLSPIALIRDGLVCPRCGLVLA